MGKGNISSLSCNADTFSRCGAAPAPVTNYTPDLSLDGIGQLVSQIGQVLAPLHAHVLRHDEEISTLKERLDALEGKQVDIISSTVIPSALEPTYRAKNGLYSSSAVGASFKLSGKKLNKILQEQGIHEPLGDGWQLTAAYQSKGYADERGRAIKPLGNAVHVVTFAWTERGANFIVALLKKLGHKQYSKLDNTIRAKKPFKQRKTLEKGLTVFDLY